MSALFEEGAADRGFFLSGGTALAEYYLHHRYSDDLDLFSRKEVDFREEFNWMRASLARHGLVASPPGLLGKSFARFFVGEPRETAPPTLKIELVHDQTARLEPEVPCGVVVVDSFLDIAVNKVLALADRREPKDAADVYFVLTRTRWALEYLMDLSQRKDTRFEYEWGLLELADRLVNLERTGFLEKVRFRQAVDMDEIVRFLRAEGHRLLARLRPEPE